MKFANIVVLLGIVLLETNLVLSHDHHERHLIQDLLKEYEPLERPVAKDEDAVDVKYELKLIKISKFRLKEQTLSTIVWINMEWTDINLQWNPSDYGNIKETRITPDKIWTPDVVPYTAENIDNAEPYDLGSRVVVDSKGKCVWVPPMKLKSICAINDTSANEQTCKIKLGSWTYNGNKVNVSLRNANVDLSQYVPNRKWALTKATAEREEVKYDPYPEKYITLIYTFNLKKQGLLGRMLGWN